MKTNHFANAKIVSPLTNNFQKRQLNFTRLLRSAGSFVLSMYGTNMIDDKKNKIGFLRKISELLKQYTKLANPETKSDRKGNQKIGQDSVLLKTLIDNLPDAIFAKDIKGRKIISNLADVHNMGLRSEEEALGKTDLEIFPEEIARGFTENDHLVMQTGKPILKREEFFIDKEGNKHWLHTSKLPLKDDEGRVIGLIGIGRDITQQKALSEALQKERILLRTIIDNIPDVIYVKDLECRKAVANLADVHNMGLTSENEAMGKTDFDFYPKEIAEGFYANDQSVLKTGKPILNREEFFISPEGEKSWLLTSKLPLKDEQGTIVGIIGIGRDITKRKLAEESIQQTNEELEKTNEALTEANKVKDRFLANMSHELRTPLIGILGYAAMLVENLGKTENGEMAQGIKRSGDRLLRTLNLLLNFSSIGSEQFEISISNKDIIEDLKSVFNMFQGAALEKKLEFSLRILDDDLTGKVDSGVLTIILENLIHNAVKFTKSGSIAIIAGKEGSDKVFVKVKDTGIGIDKKYFNKIFEEFRQVSEGTNREFQGTGLGLAIVKKYVGMLNGEINVQSTLGEGSTFTITLPA